MRKSEIRIIPKLCPPASENGGSCPPRSYGGAVHGYRGLWDIKFNPAKSQVVRFGSGNNQFCDIYLNGSAVPVVDKDILVFTLNVNQVSVISPRPLSDFIVSSTI